MQKAADMMEGKYIPHKEEVISELRAMRQVVPDLCVAQVTSLIRNNHPDWAINQRRVRQLLRLTERTMKSEVVEVGNAVAVQPVSDTFAHPDGYEMVSPHIPPAVPQRDNAIATQCVIC